MNQSVSQQNLSMYQQHQNRNRAIVLILKSTNKLKDDLEAFLSTRKAVSETAHHQACALVRIIIQLMELEKDTMVENVSDTAKPIFHTWNRFYTTIRKLILKISTTKILNIVLERLKTHIENIITAKSVEDDRGCTVYKNMFISSVPPTEPEAEVYDSYNESGQITNNITVTSNGFKFLHRYKGGREDGENLIWYPTGQLFSKKFYKEGKNEGEQLTWWDNGQLSSKHFYKDWKQEGCQFYWFKDGQLSSKSFYKEGRLEGEQLSYYDNRQVMATSKASKTHYQLESKTFYKDGKKEGKQFLWFKSGQLLSKSFYKEGEREGEQLWWWQNGQLMSKSFYKEGKKEGEQIRWFENGQLSSLESYKEGKQAGLGQIYKGKLIN